jgi:hypothetical protein
MAYPSLPPYYTEHADLYTPEHLKIINQTMEDIHVFFANNKTLLKRNKLTLAAQIRLINSQFGLTVRYAYVRKLKCGIMANTSMFTLTCFARFWGVELFQMLTPNCFEDVGHSLPVSSEPEKQTDVW